MGAAKFISREELNVGPNMGVAGEGILNEEATLGCRLKRKIRFFSRLGKFKGVSLRGER